MPATSADRDALRLELKEIIDTDAKAAEILRLAREKRREIEENTKKERQAILNSAKEEIAKITEEVRREQRLLYDEQKAKETAEHQAQRERLQKKMDEHHDRYVDEIFGHIINGD